MTRPFRTTQSRRRWLRHASSPGQALAEFALLLPLLMALTGAAIDFARVYQASITLQTATRNAAEYTATRTADRVTAESEAQRIVCTEAQTIPGFVAGPGGSVASCTSPTLTVSAFSVSATAPGASATYPVGSSTVAAELDFRTVIPWPWLPDSVWTIRATQSYSIIQGR
ncbi:MAG TPA: TadE/TadG family type IV pilus assembly protein [Candidatus Limnocylindria bacterium]|nr:TadE/TadG family type IV pilus assembly protein [Candidatus Limnocylindria bacterium]